MFRYISFVSGRRTTSYWIKKQLVIENTTTVKSPRRRAKYGRREMFNWKRKKMMKIYAIEVKEKLQLEIKVRSVAQTLISNSKNWKVKSKISQKVRNDKSSKIIIFFWSSMPRKFNEQIDTFKSKLSVGRKEIVDFIKNFGCAKRNWNCKREKRYKHRCSFCRNRFKVVK